MTSIVRIIGEQPVREYADQLQEIQEIIKAEVDRAKRNGKPLEAFDIAIEAFLLGVIHGKRRERQKRRRKATA